MSLRYYQKMAKYEDLADAFSKKLKDRFAGRDVVWSSETDIEAALEVLDKDVKAFKEAARSTNFSLYRRFLRAADVAMTCLIVVDIISMRENEAIIEQCLIDNDLKEAVSNVPYYALCDWVVENCVLKKKEK